MLDAKFQLDQQIEEYRHLSRKMKTILDNCMINNELCEAPIAGDISKENEKMLNSSKVPGDSVNNQKTNISNIVSELQNLGFNKNNSFAQDYNTQKSMA